MIEISNAAREMINFEDYLDEHEKKSHEDKLFHVSTFMDEALKYLDGGGKINGDPMPWGKTQDRFRFRPGEVTIWAGVNGSGKSLVMGQCALTLAQMHSVGIASFEMKPAATVSRMIQQCAGSKNTTKEYTDRISKKLNLYIYDHVGTVKPSVVYGMCHYMAVEKNIKHIMIDSLMKCGVDSRENELQKRFISKLQDIAKEHDIHIHLVHHMRKKESETSVPDKTDVKGAGELVDLTDNLLIVYRNKIKELKVMNNEPFDDETPDCFVWVNKQRNYEWEGKFAFWFHRESLQWCEFSNRKRHNYVE